METEQPYTDETLLKLTDNVSVLLKDIPIKKLLKKYRKQKAKPQNADPLFIAYVEDNLERFQKKAKDSNNQGLVEAIEQLLFSSGKKHKETKEELLSQICSEGKAIFFSQQAAKQRLGEIRKSSNDDRKKPIRSYQCDICGYWHHTSMPLEVWKLKNSKTQ